MWNSVAQPVVMAQIDNPRLAVPSSALSAALNGYHDGRYLLLGTSLPLGILARRQSGLALLQAPGRGDNAETDFADRFTGGATINLPIGQPDRISGSRFWQLTDTSRNRI